MFYNKVEIHLYAQCIIFRILVYWKNYRTFWLFFYPNVAPERVESSLSNLTKITFLRYLTK